MCGIMGYVRTRGSSANRQAMLEALMVEIERRGEHAAGVGAMSEQLTIWGKAPIKPSFFIRGKTWERTMSLKPRLLIGHARYATSGKPSDNKNNHPFVSKNHRWMVVHNGVITDKVADVECESQCDSEVVLRLLERDGVKQTVATMNGWKKSSFAILAINTAERIMYAWRNSKSPCVVADLTESVGGVVLCSTREILADAAKKVGVSLKGVKVYELKAGWFYTLPMGMDGAALDTWEMATVEPPVRKPKATPEAIEWVRNRKQAMSEDDARAQFALDFEYYRNYPLNGVDVRKGVRA